MPTRSRSASAGLWEAMSGTSPRVSTSAASVTASVGSGPARSGRSTTGEPGGHARPRDLAQGPSVAKGGDAGVVVAEDLAEDDIGVLACRGGLGGMGQLFPDELDGGGDLVVADRFLGDPGE